jgi:hypothetical protein
MYTLQNILSTSPENCNIGYNNSWLNVKNNAGRQLYSQASYITNFDDLSISLSAADVNIGNVHISDSTTGLYADVVSTGVGSGALRVISQDLESSEDDVTIGDKQGNFSTINTLYSALKVYPVITSGGFTIAETKTSGNPSFIPSEVLIHNSSNDDVFVNFTLTSGTSCLIPIGKNASPNHILKLNIAVLSVNDYAGCQITYFA